MTSAVLRFDRFALDPANRRLTRDDAPVELNARYLDALALLVREHGALVSKDRFMAEVWRGVPVTDEALTQCIRTLRRQLGDDAARPRFIETVPKHGYRFIAAVADPQGAKSIAPETRAPRRLARLASAGAAGGGAAGAAGGIIYGFTIDAQPAAPGIGGASVLIVLLCVCAAVGAAGGAGVGGGIAATRRAAGSAWRWAAVGGGLGGLVVGAVAKLLGRDAFALLLGRSPGEITGAVEGLVLGAAVGLGGWLGSVGPARDRLGYRIAVAGAAGGVAGVGIALAGGRLMAGSLDLLARGFPGSRLRIDQVGAVFGEDGFDTLSRIVTTGSEGMLFAACVVGAMLWAERGASTPGH